MGISTKLKIMGSTMKEGDPLELIRRLRKLAYSTTETYVLRRDLTIPLIPRPQAMISINVRCLEPNDVPQIAAERPEGLLLGVLKVGLPQCYVALTEDNQVCYLHCRT
jgi:hypothetical protein